MLNVSVDFILRGRRWELVTRNKGQKKRFQGTYKCEVKSKFIRVYICMYVYVEYYAKQSPGTAVKEVDGIKREKSAVRFYSGRLYAK